MKRYCSRRGQALVEFAVTLPLFIVLLVFSFYTVLTLYDYFTLQEIVREAARQRVAYELERLPDAKLRTHLKDYGSLSGNYTFDANSGADLKIEIDQTDKETVDSEKFVLVTARAERTAQADLLPDIVNFPPRVLSYSLRMRQEW